MLHPFVARRCALSLVLVLILVLSRSSAATNEDYSSAAEPCDEACIYLQAARESSSLGIVDQSVLQYNSDANEEFNKMLVPKKLDSFVVYYSLADIMEPAAKLERFLHYTGANANIYRTLAKSDLISMLQAVYRSYKTELDTLASELVAKNIVLSSAHQKNQDECVTMAFVESLLARCQDNFLGVYTYHIQFLIDFNRSFFGPTVFLHSSIADNFDYFATISKTEFGSVFLAAQESPKTLQLFKDKVVALLSHANFNVSQWMLVLITVDHAYDTLCDLLMKHLTVERIGQMPMQVKKYLFLKHGLTLQVSWPSISYDFGPELDLIFEVMSSADVPLIHRLLGQKELNLTHIVSIVMNIYETVPGTKGIFLGQIDLRATEGILTHAQFTSLFFHAPNATYFATLTATEYARALGILCHVGWTEQDVTALSTYLKAHDIYISKNATRDPLYSKLFNDITSKLVTETKVFYVSTKIHSITNPLGPFIARLSYAQFKTLDAEGQTHAFLHCTSYDEDIYRRLQVRDLHLIMSYILDHWARLSSAKAQITSLAASLEKDHVRLSTKCESRHQMVTKTAIKTMLDRFRTKYPTGNPIDGIALVLDTMMTRFVLGE